PPGTPRPSGGLTSGCPGLCPHTRLPGPSPDLPDVLGDRTPALSRLPGAGLTSKPRHAQRPTVALRGSFRPRLASTTGEVPRATTDPDVGPSDDRHDRAERATWARDRGTRAPR